MTEKKPFYLTTTLPYVNAPLHMGHALEFVRADAIARYKKLSGCEVYFNTGTDEHGAKIYEKAQEVGLSAQEFTDKGFVDFKKSLEMFGMIEDIHFIRTTDENHIKAAQEFWKRCDRAGYIYKKDYSIKYCVGCESEKSDSELEQGKCIIHPNRELEYIEEENYFFKYSEFGEKLSRFYENNPTFIIPDFRFNEIKQFVKGGLEDFSISRLRSKMPWGVPVPGDDSHVMYVWFDALTNYISTLGWPKENGDFEKFWVNGTPTQYCGKDNTRFQGAMWQAMLMASGVPNSKQIIVNGFITGGGGVKMSKSLGNVVDPKDIAREYGTDALRFFLLGEVGSFEDSPFTVERFKDAYNAKLSNGLGNLSSRVLALTEKYLNKSPNIPESLDLNEYFTIYESYDLKKAVDYVWQKVNELDKFIQETEPFRVVKTDEKKGKGLLSKIYLELYQITCMISPIMPATHEKLKALILTNKKPEVPLFPRKD